MSTSIDALFDPPGPKGLRSQRIATVVSSLAITALVVLMVYRFAAAGGLDRAKWEIFNAPGSVRLIGTALGSTLKVAVTAGLLAFVLAVVLAMLRMVAPPAVQRVVAVYVEVTRSLPTLLVLYFTILFLPDSGLNMPVYWQLVLALVITNAALISEILRASLLSIPRGQTEAAMSLGVTRPRAVRLILLPQALRAATPALISQLVYLLKASTLGYVVSYTELLYIGRVIGEYTGNLLQSYLVVTAIFLLVNVVLSRLALLLQVRLSRRGAVTVSLPKESG
ncbi:amino acid ABC transporter permease [Streptomyces antimycoticus]|uniref:amino acid ABC transporter permease n=1 Tax=Streptomyces antimycoticus TaxID=68175 RepID=UPI0036AB2942